MSPCSGKFHLIPSQEAWWKAYMFSSVMAPITSIYHSYKSLISSDSHNAAICPPTLNNCFQLYYLVWWVGFLIIFELFDLTVLYQLLLKSNQFIPSQVLSWDHLTLTNQHKQNHLNTALSFLHILLSLSSFHYILTWRLY